MNMIERIKHGIRPTQILREIKAENPVLRNFDLSFAFEEKFVGIPSEDIQAIWYWKSGERVNGLDDEELDAILLSGLRKAGLL